MKIFVIDKTEKTKLFRFINGEKTIDILTCYVSSKPEVQAIYLEHNGQRYDRWREHGSFMKLVNKCLGTTFTDNRGDRKNFLESIYSEKFEEFKKSEIK